MKKKILFFGNCQTGAIINVLNLNDSFTINHIVCHKTNINKKKFTSLIKNQDIIVTQHIAKNYRNLEYLNTSYVLNNINTNTIIIIFNSCYFDFYYPDLKYIRHNNKLINKPHDYHYQYMIDCYKRGDTIKNYIDNYVNNPNLITKKSLLERATNSINELKKRDIRIKKEFCKKNNVHFISITDYIENNYMDKLLFYSMNHPTKYLFHFISEQIIKILNIRNNIKYNIDPLNNPRCILYKCLENHIRFKIDNNFLTLGCKKVFSITKLYFDTYNKINFKKYLE